MEQIEKAKSFKPTSAMVANAKRGLAARAKAPDSQKGGLSASEAKAEGVGSGVVRARDIINGNLSLDTVKRIYSFLSRSRQHYKPKERTASGGLTPGTQAYLSWGGSAGLAWSRSILRQEGIIKSYTKEITEEDLNTADVPPAFAYKMEDNLNEDLMQATFIVMVPDEVDLHGDITSAEEIRKSCHSFNKHSRTANLFHLAKTDTFEFAESYIAPTDFILGDKFVKKGTWVCTVQCLDKGLWELIKSGEICGVSIGAMATVESIED